jgi:hypothetical protein
MTGRHREEGPALRGKRQRGKGGIRAALSLARIVMINVFALVITAGVTAHVLLRPTGPRPALLARGILAAHPTSTLPSAPPVEVDLEIAKPAAATTGTMRQPE